MKRILLIIQREFLSRTRKKSFWIMIFIGPLLFALGLILPLWIGAFQNDKKVIEVLDHTGKFQYQFTQAPGISFAYFNGDLNGRISNFLRTDHYAILYIPESIASKNAEVILYSKNKISPEIKFYLHKNLNELLSLQKLKVAGVNEELLNSSMTDVSLIEKNIISDGSGEDETAAGVVAGLFSSVLILFFIVLYGGQVMRGVIEEKSNRIIEVVISSVRPFELMIGKIAGIALVSLTQFIMWITITAAVSTYLHTKYEKAFELFSDKQFEQTLNQNPKLDVAQAMEINKVIHAVNSIDYVYILCVFMFYFIGGYLLFAAIFAGIGSVVDSETDTQQFVFPLIAPLMFVMIMATSIVNEPHGDLAFWLSIIPFTSPVAMMLRLPFDVPVSELLLSMSILVIAFLLFTWISAKVYRAGILMYGKKLTLSEIWRTIVK